jgi:dihydroorotase-like cyclic amidohydrolase
LLTPKRFVEVFSQRPSKFLNLPAEFGEFKIGERFHGILLDAQFPATPVVESDFASLSKNSCFIGQSLPGKLRKAFHGSLVHSFT